MATTTLPAFLRDRRARVQPTPTKPSATSKAPRARRTPGLRREEVAARAGVSVTWYTWLEQGRGGVPSDDVLERLAIALELDSTNREILFLLAHDRPPPRKSTTEGAPPPALPPSLRRVLDTLAAPAFVKTPTFRIVGWNKAAVAVLGDYGAVPERERNLLRRVFSAGSEHMVENVEHVRSTCLAAFRVEVARAGASSEASALVDELTATSPDFRRLWSEGDIRAHGVVQKRLVRPGFDEIVLESSVLQVEGTEGLSLCVWCPVDETSARAIAEIVRRFDDGGTEPQR